MPDASSAPPCFGERIILVGNTNAGKSALGARIAAQLDVPHIELDALFWQPGWTEPPREEFRARVAHAVASERWVMSGSYFHAQGDISWPRASQVLWLDVGLITVVPRVLRRSWGRYRRKELLWGTNRERFWGQLKFWDTRDSLIGYAIANSRAKRRELEARMTDPRWAHIAFVRLRGTKAIDAWIDRALHAADASASEAEGEQWRSA